MSRRRKHRIKLRSLYVWHRYLGLTAALFALILSVTGILLNHTERFDFDSRFVQSDLILDWYGIRPPERVASFTAGRKRITLFGKHLYLGMQELPGEHEALVGAAQYAGFIVLAVGGGVMLLDDDGAVVERLGGADGVPEGIRSLGTDSGGSLVVEDRRGYHQPDADFLEWFSWDGSPDTVAWQRPSPLPESLYQGLTEHYRGEVLPMERVLLDLHSGRIMGRYGIWVMDAAAAILLLLACTGVWMWLKRRR